MRISRCQRPARVGRELAVELETSLGEGESVVVGWGERYTYLRRRCRRSLSSRLPSAVSRLLTQG